MQTFPLTFILALIFILGVIATGIWLLKTRRYHIFYFSLCGLFLLNLFMFIKGFGFMSQAMVSSESMGDGIAYEEPGFFDGFEWFLFFRTTFLGLFLLFALLSLINPFFRKNKLAVKIVSIIMTLFNAFLVLIAYGISQMGKIGG
jgi:hypothetical protein